MGNTSKALTIFVLMILCISMATSVFATSAQSVSKPSVPEFTVKYVDYSYDVPPTYGTDEYNGKTIITKAGEHIDNRTVEIKIRNQPFTPYNDSNGNMINRFFDVRYKGAYTDKWTTMFANTTQTSGMNYRNPYMTYGYAIEDYSAEYTTILYQVAPDSGQIDFQVEALEGYTYMAGYDAHLFYSYASFTFIGQESGWSDIQTVTIPGTSVSTSYSPTVATNSPTPTTPTSTPVTTAAVNSDNSSSDDQPLTYTFLVAAVVVLSIAVVSLLIYVQKSKNRLPK